ncbi:glycohydrolase toxin TNT-related protein, partial [Porphyromonas macacae]|uniref:glycohydrolase toxin TNT-related protein n=1 Tax=Porphyromonas macacae TaxID=28115 RepID=UPI0035A15595
SSFIPFLFQGQYFDAETGLCYNRFRYYSPDTGSYISQDPIGLAGNNPTLYGYVFDTNTQIDPFGLECQAKLKGQKTTAIAPYYPPNDGALGEIRRVFLMPGDRVDRFGKDYGRYLAPEGTPMPMRALPPNNTRVYHIYEVIKPFEVEASTIAPAFGQIGLGTQYKTPLPIRNLVKRGILKPIK